MRASWLRTVLLAGSTCFALAGCWASDRGSSNASDQPVMQEGTSRSSPAHNQQLQGNAGQGNAGSPLPLSRAGVPGSGESPAR
jgi:hypothetical protein